jgi:hypothetical protein
MMPTIYVGHFLLRDEKEEERIAGVFAIFASGGRSKTGSPSGIGW